MNAKPLWIMLVLAVVGAAWLWWQRHVVPQRIKQAIQQLDYPDESAKQRAIQTLREAGEWAAPLLLEGMKTGSHAKKHQLGWLLSELKTAGWPWIKRALRDQDWRIREIGISQVHRIPAPVAETLPYLSDGLRDDNPYVRYAAVTEMGKFGPQAKSFLPDWYVLLREGNIPLSSPHDSATHNHSHDEDHPYSPSQEPITTQPSTRSIDSIKKRRLDTKTRRQSGAAVEQNKLSITRIIAGRLCHTPDDVDRESRLAIVRNIRKIDPDPARVVQQLLVALSDRDALVGRSAHRELVNMGNTVIPYLYRYIQQANSVKAYEAAHVLGDIGTPALASLSSLFLQPERDHGREGWIHAASALQRMGNKALPILPLLCRSWSALPIHQHRSLADIMAAIGTESFACMLQHSKHPSISVRVSAVYAMGRLAERDPSFLPSSRVWPQIERLLSDPERRVRHEMLWTLGRLGSRALSLRPVLLAYQRYCPLLSSVEPIDQECIQLLSAAWVQIAPLDAQFVAVLSQSLKRGHPRIQHNVLVALSQAKSISSTLYPAVLETLRSSHDLIRQTAEAVIVLHREGLAAHVGLVTTMLRKEPQNTRIHLWRILSRVQQPTLWAKQLHPLLSVFWKHASLFELPALLRVMAHLFQSNDAVLLRYGIPHLVHPSETVRIAVLSWLSQVKQPKLAWISQVIKALEDPAWRVRRQALRTLGRWGKLARQAEAVVQRKIRDPAFEVSMTAQKTLLQIRQTKNPRR